MTESWNSRPNHGIVDRFMTMGDWIQGSELLVYAHSYRPWTGTLPECHCFEPFLRARPGLPWDMGGCHACWDPWLGHRSGLRVHVSRGICQNPQCFAVQGYIPGTTLPCYPGYTSSRLPVPAVPAKHAGQLRSTLS